MANTKEITVEFERERETPNKQRFKELGTKKVVGMLYVSKKDDESMGKPKKVTVVIKAG
jgi:hypothetical protein